MRSIVKMSVIFLLACLISACATADINGYKDNLRIGPVPLIHVEF